MESKLQRALLTASVAGLLAVVGSGLLSKSAGAEEAKDGGAAACYGVNKCKGVGECGGKGHTCAGTNECAGKGYIKIDKSACLKIQNGRLTEEPVKS